MIQAIIDFFSRDLIILGVKALAAVLPVACFEPSSIGKANK
jgi:hypothetical protein